MAEHQPTTRKRPLVPAVVATIAALLAIGLILVPQLRGDEPDAEPGTEPTVEAADPSVETMARRERDDPLALGAVDAPVVLVEYSDFQCPFCGRFARETKPTLIREYVDEGVLRLEWRDFPYLGAESRVAARAARAAAEQDRFWDFHDALFDHQQPPNSGRVTERYLVDVARQVGLDLDRFRQAMNEPEAEHAIQRDFLEGQTIGVTGTPAFLVNGQPIMGAQPTEVFEQAIEDAAAAAP